MELDHNDYFNGEEYEYINGRKIVKKHVATIHCSNKLSLLERKISNVLLYHAFPDLKNQLTHELTLDRLKRLLNSNTRNHKALKEALKTLISSILEWNLLGDELPDMELEGWNASTILSSVSVKKGVIKYQYSELIKTLIADPSIYGKINLVIQARFKSAYALALYENCSRYRGLEYTKNIDFMVFRKLMGVDEDKYDIFRDFNRRVLQPAVTEINTCSDIRVLPEIYRRGRKVQSIRFKMEERPIKQRLGIQKPIKNPPALTEIDEKTMEDFVGIYGKATVDKAVQYLKKTAAYQKKQIHNMGGYLKSIIENDYSKSVIITPPARNTLSKDQQKEIDWRLHKHDYIRCISKEVLQLFKSQSLEKQQALITMLHDKSHQILGGSAELLMTVYYNLLGNSEDRILRAITDNNMYLITFFENGFCEFLLKVDSIFKDNVIDFDAFMATLTHAK